MLVGGDDRRGDFRPGEELAVVRGHEIRADLLGDELRTIRLDLGQSDEVDLWVAGRDFTAEQSDPARADDGKTDALGVLLCHPMLQAMARPSAFPIETGSRRTSASGSNTG